MGVDPIFKGNTVCLDLEFKTDSAVKKYKEHPSIINIREKAVSASAIQFENVNPWEIMNQIETLEPKKSNSGDVPTKIIHMTKEIQAFFGPILKLS